MGNTVVWKPASTAALLGALPDELLQAAGLPPGVINLVYGSGAEIGDAALASPDLAGVHFTGSTPVFQSMWKTIGENIANYRNYPRIVGETGGKDFIVAHESADVEAVATAIVRARFEYQGQKCSAASRLFAPSTSGPRFASGRRPGRVDQDGRRLRFPELHGRRHRRGLVQDAKGRDRGGEGKQGRRSSSAAATTIREGWFVEPTVVETTTRTSARCATSCSARS